MCVWKSGLRSSVWLDLQDAAPSPGSSGQTTLHSLPFLKGFPPGTQDLPCRAVFMVRAAGLWAC